MSFWEREIRFGRGPHDTEPEPAKEERPDLRPRLERGEDGVTELLERLHSSNFGERIAAAQALPESNDARVLPALMAAFRDTFPGRSSRLFLLVGRALTILALGANLVAYAGRGWVPEWARFIALLFVGIFLLLRWPGHRDHTPEFRAALTEALIKVAERHPVREMCAIADDLQLVSKEVHTLTPEQRREARTARARLMELAGDFRWLPVVADEPERDDAAVLPRVSVSSEVQTGALPVAVQNVGSGEPPP